MKQLIYSFFLLVLISCAEDHIGQTPTDGTAPSTITAVEVESTPGGAKISYTYNVFTTDYYSIFYR